MTIPGSPTAEGPTDKTSRESYDEFVAQLEEMLAVIGEPTGWSADFGNPWPLEPDTLLTPEVCDRDNPENSPRQISMQLLGPGTEDPQSDRDAMIRYMENQGLEISGVFGDPSYPEGVSWDALGRGEDGVKISYATSTHHRALTLYGKCSSHPSMQNKVSRDTP